MPKTVIDDEAKVGFCKDGLADKAKTLTLIGTRSVARPKLRFRFLKILILLSYAS